MKTLWQNPFEYFDQIYLINLDRRTDRLEHFMQEAASINLPYFFRISGIEHRNPATGCHLSHAACYSHAIYEGYDRILILEDDVEFFQDPLTNIKCALEELPSDWDMFYLGANLDRYLAYKVSEHIAKLTGAFATHAYASRRNLFHTLFDINANESIPHNDVYYAQAIHPNYNCYLAMPLIAGQREDYSDIQGTIMSSNQMFKDRLERNLVK